MITKKDLDLLRLAAIKTARQGCKCCLVVPIKYFDNEEFYRNEFVVNGNYIVCEYNYKQKIGFVTLNGLEMCK